MEGEILMRWEQELVNSQINVNRAVWEMNGGEPSKLSREDYILQQIKEAEESFQKIKQELKKDES